MQEDKRYAAYVRKHKQFRNDSEHNGKSSFVAIPRYKYFHCRYCKYSSIKERKGGHISLNSQIERENELKYNTMTLKLTKGTFCFPGTYFTRLNKYRECFFF